MLSVQNKRKNVRTKYTQIKKVYLLIVLDGAVRVVVFDVRDRYDDNRFAC